MSLILEALNKAEQNQGNSTSYNTPPPYLPVKNSTTKWTPLLLVAAAAITSAIVTFLIFYNVNSNSESTHTASVSIQSPAPTIANNIDQQQSTEKHNITLGYKSSNTQVTTSKEPHQSNALSKNSDLIINREPSLHSLVKNPNHSKKEQQAPHKVNSHKEDIATKTTTTYTVPNNDLDAQTTKNQPVAKNITRSSNLEIANIKIDVHMYSETPSKRFVYINSARYGEGSMISNGIFLNEITENGIILNNHGTLYRLPIKL